MKTRWDKLLDVLMAITIPVAIFVFMFVLLVLLPEDSCEQWRNSPISNVPARCVSYFQDGYRQ